MSRKIYTKKGDKGQTDLSGGGRVDKNSLRIEVCGTVDELNSVVGVARSFTDVETVYTYIEKIQNDLFMLGSDITTPLMVGEKDTLMIRIGQDHIDWLESKIDELSSEIPQLQNFILPGGGKASAFLQLSRTVCRRAERWAVALGHQEDIGEFALPYLNRLSDFLFVLARYVNAKEGIDESNWRIKG